MSTEQDAKADEFLTLINKAWEMLDEGDRPSYNDFNVNIPWGDNRQDLNDLEKENPMLGISKAGKLDVGMSTLSILATMSDVMCGRRLCANIDDNSRISGWVWYDPAWEEFEKE